MSMRRPSARGRKQSVHFSLPQSGWTAAQAATLRHTSLPWGDFAPTETEGISLSECRSRGRRDLLSAIAQFAAHLSFLRFAGIQDNAFDPDDWRILLKRGEDCRLLRVRAPANRHSEVPVLSLIQQMAEMIVSPPLDVLSQTWAKSESVFREAWSQLGTDAAADRRWVRACATGRVLSPGPIALQQFLDSPKARLLYADSESVEALATLLHEVESHRLFLIGGEESSLLSNYSAASCLADLAGPLAGRSPGELAEAVAGQVRGGGTIIALQQIERFDPRSRELVRVLLESAADISWLVPRDYADILGTSGRDSIEPTRFFVLSPRLVAAQELHEIMQHVDPPQRRAWTETWSGVEFDSFIERGVVPELPAFEDLRKLQEPKRSYLAALALIGPTIRPSIASAFLADLGCVLSLSDLALERISSLTSDGFRFASESVRTALAEQLSFATSSPLCRAAASLLSIDGAFVDAAALYLQSGDAPMARESLERSCKEPGDRDDVAAIIGRFPDSFLRSSALVCEQLAQALIRQGAYSRSRDFSPFAQSPMRETLQALAYRRQGKYAKALQILEALPGIDFTHLLLEGEILRLTGQCSEAGERFAQCRTLISSDQERHRLDYEMALTSLDENAIPQEEWLADAESAGSQYLGARYRSYLAHAGHDYMSAVQYASRARDLAQTVPDQIDASLDVLYAWFMAGSWEQARHEARRTLAMVEETDGDRAAGGALFTLAYLCAEEGQWDESAEKIGRLRRFYSLVNDQERLKEVDLLVAQNALTRCSFDRAATLASSLLESKPRSPLIREAAGLIVDEVNWIRGQDQPLHASGGTGCVTLDNRHALMRARVERDVASALAGFDQVLLQWERRGVPIPFPETDRRSERLRILRSLFGCSRRGASPYIRDAAERLCSEFEITPSGLHPKEQDAHRELKFLQLAAARDFPYDDSVFEGEAWLFATRNRLGRWSQVGSHPVEQPEVLERLLKKAEGDWISCGDEGLLYLRGISIWSEESRRALADLVRLRSEHANLRRIFADPGDSIADRPSPPSGLVGDSALFLKALQPLARIAVSDVPVLILGESGTGKELFARAVHDGSSRRGKPFTAVNCAALPETLVESELFGHARGAFTGAERDRPGLIEISQGGTLFLDEIGELPSSSQAKLLRFLQEGEFRRVGESAVRTADVRIVAATNRKLEQSVDEGRFREDLYYRIRVGELNVPPLRDRGSDIVLLARHFLRMEHLKQRGGAERISDEVEMILLSYRWPGNVRELQNTVRAAHALGGSARTIEIEHLPERLRGVAITRKQTGSYFEELVQFKRSLVERSLLQAKGNQNQAAKLLGMSRQALAYQIRELGIMVKEPRARSRT